jgi:hypothetical protein
MALLIDSAYESFGFLRGPRVDVAQQTIQRERADSDEVRRIFHGLLMQTVHRNYHSSAA